MSNEGSQENRLRGKAFPHGNYWHLISADTNAKKYLLSSAHDMCNGIGAMRNETNEHGHRITVE